MSLRIRAWAFFAAVLAASLTGYVAGVGAQAYPNRAIRIIDAYPPGGAADFQARTMAPKLSAAVGQSVVVENRPGAGGNVGAEVAAKSPPDGYTLFIGLTSAIAPSVTLYPKLAYDPMKDFLPVSRVGQGVYVFVSHPSLPVKSVKDVIALAQSHPGRLNYASSGNGSGPHLAGELFKARTGVNLVHVPYKGGPPSVTAVISGETEIGFMSVASASAQIKAGKLRAIGVTTPRRIAAMPDVPTIVESGVPGYEVVPTFGIYVPSGTPKDIVSILNAEFRKIVGMQDVRERFATQGLEAMASTPEELSKVLAAEIALWAKVIKDAGIRVE
jgi:tripartite-type tricarboxylate transporter receptor subunit TctC